MKHAKLPYLAALTFMALAACAGTASATYVTSTGSSNYTGKVTATSTHTQFDLDFFSTVTCTSSRFEARIEKHGTGVTAGGNIFGFAFDKCGDDLVTLVKPGSLEFHGTSPTGNATVTSSGVEIVFHINPQEITCTAVTSGTDIGNLTGTDSTGKAAVLDINSAAIPVTGGSFFCPSSVIWTGTYTVTEPTLMGVH